MKGKTLFVLLLVATCLYGQAPLLRSFTLQGSLSFREIIAEAQTQTGVQFKLPQLADSQVKRDYQQTISIETLLNAIVANFKKSGLQVDWRLDGEQIIVFDVNKATPNPPVKPAIEEELAPIESIDSQRQIYKKSASALPTRSPVTNQYSQQVNNNKVSSMEPSTEELLQKLTRELIADPGPATRIHIPANTNGNQNYRAQRQITDRVGMDSLEELSDLSTLQPVRSMPTLPTRKARNTSISITAYPESHVPSYNDAPPLDPGANMEDHQNWMTRMYNALQSKKYSTLSQEMEETEKRLRWLKEHLPHQYW